MKIATAFLISFGISFNALAGASNIRISCKGEKVNLTGSVPGSIANFKLTAKVKGNNGINSLTLRDDFSQQRDGLPSEAVIIDDLKNGVFVAHIREKESGALIEFYALPKTVKLKMTNSGKTASFNAKANISSETVGSAQETVNCNIDDTI